MIAKLLYGYKATQCLYVAAKLNIADYLANGAQSIDQLAIQANAQPDPLYRVMRCLTSLGIFQEEPSKIFSLNESAKELLSDSINTMKDFVVLCGEDLYHAAGNLLHTIITGHPAFDDLYGMSYWDYLDANPEKAKIFHDAMETGSLPMIRKIISHYDFAGYQRIVDVGGGKGHLICEILSQHPHTNGLIYDLAHATQAAYDYVDKLQLLSRCAIITGNFLNMSIPAADLYLLKVVLHDWDDEHATLILKNCRKNLCSTGKIVIIEKIIEDNQYKDMTCLGDINMLATLRGRERNLNEYSKLLTNADFRLSKKIVTTTVFSIIEAEPI